MEHMASFLQRQMYAVGEARVPVCRLELCCGVEYDDRNHLRLHCWDTRHASRPGAGRVRDGALSK